MPGAVMQFSLTLGSGDTFDLPDSFNTASVCPVAGSSGSYTIGQLIDGSEVFVSPTLLDITSFPELSGNVWNAHRVTCTAGSVIVKFQNQTVK